VPGPACYGGGNDQPTVTDANLLLGYLNPVALAGGTVPVNPDLARKAIESHIAGPMGREVMETAYGIHTVANANMMKAVKGVTTYRGRDPRDFALLAFGGSGGVHAVDLARVLQVKEVIVPVAAGVFSALGLLFSDFKVNETAPFLHLVKDMPLDEMERRFAALAERIAKIVGGAAAAITFERQADVRFAGQAYELTVPFPDDQSAKAVDGLCERFEAAHRERYGHAFSGEFPVEVVNLRLVGSRKPDGAREIKSDRKPRSEASGSRMAYFGPERGSAETLIVDRAYLIETPTPGPLVIEEYEGTTVVPPDCTARLDKVGNVVIEFIVKT